MSYLKRTVNIRNTIETKKYFAARYGVKGNRAERQNPTPEKMKKINEKNAVEKLRWRFNANFEDGDVHLILTYRKANRPDPAGAKENLEKYIRKLRCLYKSAGKELKYIAVTEYKNTAIHHHLVLNNIDMSKVCLLWEKTHGRARPNFLNTNGEYGKLAKYLVKETRKTFRDPDAPAKKRWNESKNLEIPIPKVEIISSKKWRDIPAAPKGYRLDPDSVKNCVDDFWGYPVQEYVLIAIPPTIKMKKRSR